MNFRLIKGKTTSGGGSSTHDYLWVDLFELSGKIKLAEAHQTTVDGIVKLTISQNFAKHSNAM